MNRPSIPRLLALGSCLALVAYAFVFTTGQDADNAPVAAVTVPTPGHAPNLAGAATASPTPTAPAGPPTVFPPANSTFLGVMTQAGPTNFAALDAFNTATSHPPQVFEFSQGWAVAPFNRSLFDQVAARGMMPLVSWEPWDYTAESPIDRQRGIEPAYKLSNIINGDFDAYITSWAKGVKSLGYPVGIRFAHEMNGYWYPWDEQVNGNKPGQYVEAYRHVHDIFTKVGATNAVWVWSPNIDYNGSTSLSELYPGNKYVDWIGLSGYYGTVGLENYESFNQIFDPTFADLKRFTSKPIVITETAATNSQGLKAKWIKQMFTELPLHPDIIGVIWFEANEDGADWRVSANSAASSAWKAGASAPRFDFAWDTNTLPQLGGGTIGTAPATVGPTARK